MVISKSLPAAAITSSPAGNGLTVAGVEDRDVVAGEPHLQVDALTAAGCYRVFTETASGARADRPILDQVLDRLRPGDTLVVWKLDRLGRSLRHLIDAVTGLAERGIGFRSLQRRSTPPLPAASSSSTRVADRVGAVLSPVAERGVDPHDGPGGCSASPDPSRPAHRWR
jgi:hypothetical protein